MGLGPWALGHRSILVDPTFAHMKAILNARVKHREAFRPFAPVIPLEDISKVFEQEVASPFMLLVPKIKPELQSKIPAVTHQDGTGRVQTVTEEDNPYFYHLCHKLVDLRQGPPVLLNTSFNVAGQPIVETPEEAIKTFLSTDIDYLSIENFWIQKRDVPVLSYEENIHRVAPTPMPHGLPAGQPGVTELMKKLDRALFFGENKGCPWTEEELKKLSSIGGLYKETSELFPESPFHGTLRTQLSNRVVILLDPKGESKLVDLKQEIKPTSLSFEEAKILLAVCNAPRESLEKLRLNLQLTTLEFHQRIQKAIQQLAGYGIETKPSYLKPLEPDTYLATRSEQTLAPLADESFSARQSLAELHDCLCRFDYTKDSICSLLKVKSLQEIEPTHLHYYDHYLLPNSILGDLIRLFHLRSSLPEKRLIEIFGPNLFQGLINLGIFILRGQEWASRIDLFYADGLYIATDHRFMILPEDRIEESPVMYLGLDSMGLVYTAPRYTVYSLLDLCCGSGVQGLVASRYAHQVTGVDINPRSIRFSRFNAQLNGIRNIRFCLGSLYEPVAEQHFDTILANPPFVPSPKTEYRFRDGGTSGEEILSEIIKDSAAHLTKEGRLFIVTDLVDVQHYQTKLDRWWTGEPAHKLVLQTADRNDLLFSVPHSHAPFGQTFEEYKAELDQWVKNFHMEEIQAVNFGYILIGRLAENAGGSYYTRTIHNPTTPIHKQVKEYFQQRTWLESGLFGQKFLLMARDLFFRLETNHNASDRNIELFSPTNQYFTTYKVSNQIYQLLQDIDQSQPRLDEYLTPANQKWLFDLIYKGILYLSDERLSGNGNSNGQSKAATTPSSGLTVAELETKTTPTCLSAYLS